MGQLDASWILRISWHVIDLLQIFHLDGKSATECSDSKLDEILTNLVLTPGRFSTCKSSCGADFDILSMSISMGDLLQIFPVDLSREAATNVLLWILNPSIFLFLFSESAGKSTAPNLQQSCNNLHRIWCGFVVVNFPSAFCESAVEGSCSKSMRSTCKGFWCRSVAKCGSHANVQESGCFRPDKGIVRVPQIGVQCSEVRLWTLESLVVTHCLLLCRTSLKKSNSPFWGVVIHCIIETLFPLLALLQLGVCQTEELQYILKLFEKDFTFLLSDQEEPAVTNCV